MRTLTWQLQKKNAIRIVKNVNKNTALCLGDSKETGLETNWEKMKHVYMSRHQSARQDRKYKTNAEQLKNAAQLEYLATAVRSQN